MSFEFMKWGRWPVGTFVQMSGIIGGIPVTMERVLVFVDEKEYILNQNTTIGGQKNSVKIRKTHAVKSLVQGKIKEISIGNESEECVEFRAEYIDGSQESMWLRTSLPFTDCKFFYFFFYFFFSVAVIGSTTRRRMENKIYCKTRTFKTRNSNY
jgi:hypothetical protein